MNKHRISRRHIIKLGSITAVSVVSSPLIVTAKDLPEEIVENRGEIQTAADEICFMNAVDMSNLLRTKKISAREVMQAHLKQIAKINSTESNNNANDKNKYRTLSFSVGIPLGK